MQLRSAVSYVPIGEHPPKQLAKPYATLASLYDDLPGDRFFPALRRTFEWLVRRYGIRFTSAADVACGTCTFVRYLRECGVPVVCGVDRSLEIYIGKLQCRNLITPQNTSS